MGTLNTINYVWTLADQDVYANYHAKQACGGYPQCSIVDVPDDKDPEPDPAKKRKKRVHVCYVTPYGLSPGDPSIKSVAVGAVNPTIALEKSVEHGRALRFHVESSWSSAAAEYRTNADCEWVPFEVPASITTLGELCEHLMSTDPKRFPSSVYGEWEAPKVVASKNAARMLFDYWSNSAYRQAVTATAGFKWSTYTDDPRKLPVEGTFEKDGLSLRGRISHVAEIYGEAPPVSVGPGLLHSLNTPGDDTQIDAYIGMLNDAANAVEVALVTADGIMRERLSLLGRVNALREMAKATMTGPEGATSVGWRILEQIGGDEDTDKIYGAAKTALEQAPIRVASGDPMSTSMGFKRLLSEEIRAARTRLVGLLYNELNNEMLKNWGRSWLFNQQSKERFDPDEATPRPNYIPELAPDRLDLLCQAMSRAQRALGQCGAHADVKGITHEYLLGILERQKDDGATTGDGVDGNSPMAIVLSLVGKGGALSTTLMGNLAGPPSLSIALLETYSAWKYAKLGKEALAVMKGSTSYGATCGALKTFIDTMIKHLPDKVGPERTPIRKAVSDALLENDDEAIKTITSEAGKSTAAASQTSLAWKGSMTIIQLIGAVLALNDALGADPARDTLVKVFDWLGVLNAGASTVLGTIEFILTALGNCEAAIESLAAYGNIVGYVGAVIGVAVGAYGFFKALRDGDTTGMVVNALGAVGSAAMLIVAAGALAGLSMTPFAVIGLACIGTGIVISIVDTISDEFDTEQARMRIMTTLIEGLRAELPWQHIEQDEKHHGPSFIKARMNGVAEMCKKGPLPVGDYQQCNEPLINASLSMRDVEWFTGVRVGSAFPL